MESRYLLLTVTVTNDSDQRAIEDGLDDALGDEGIITGVDLYQGVVQADIELYDADTSEMLLDRLDRAIASLCRSAEAWWLWRGGSHHPIPVGYIRGA